MNFAQQKILHIGDTYYGAVFPWVDAAHGGTLKGLRRSIEKLFQQPDPVTFVPGHGDPVSKSELKTMAKMMEFHGAERVFGEGTFYPKDNRISIYFPDRGGTYDFAPTGDDPTPGFYARGKNPPPYEYRPPAADDDGWKVGTLEEVGMVSEPIAELVRTISVPATSVHDDDIHGLLVARHGKLVAEEYFHGFYRLKPHDTRSASKSVTATLVGAAIQNGAKLDPSTRVYDLLYQGELPQDLDPRKKEMTVEHLLTMCITGLLLIVATAVEALAPFIYSIW